MNERYNTYGPETDPAPCQESPIQVRMSYLDEAAIRTLRAVETLEARLESVAPQTPTKDALCDKEPLMSCPLEARLRAVECRCIEAHNRLEALISRLKL